MPIYTFCQTDGAGFTNYDISENAYKTLLDICCKYAYSVAFHVSPLYKKDLSEILQYQIPVNDDIKKHYSPYKLVNPKDPTAQYPYQIMHFVLTMQVKDFLYKQTDHLWGWTYSWGNQNPDDLCFFRKDNSILFSSTIHDGECRLYPKKGEDFSLVISSNNWRQIE